MPLYEYECGKCLHRFELRRHFGEDGGAACPVCTSDAKRIFSPVPILFKGSGFYITDSRKNTEHESEVKAETKVETKAENKADTKTDTKAASKADNKSAKVEAASK
jgi:putative FmdB family regulatory protein